MRSDVVVTVFVVLVLFSSISGCLGGEDKDDPIEIAKTVGATGGDLEFLSGVVKLSFPEGALDVDKDITVKAVTSMLNTTGLVQGTSFSFGPVGTSFSKGVTLTISYDPEGIPDDFDEDDLKIALYQDDGWVPFSTSIVNKVDKTVSFDVMHFSVYGVVGSDLEGDDGGDDDDDPVVEIPDPPVFSAMDFYSNFNTYLNGGSIKYAGWSGVMGNWRVFTSTFYSNQDEEPHYEYVYGANNERFILSTAYNGNYTDFRYVVGDFDSGDRLRGVYFRADPTEPEDDGEWMNGYKVTWFHSSGWIYFWVWKVVDGVRTRLDEETIKQSSYEVESGTVTVICSGPYIYISVGGVDVWSVMDDTFSSGQVGIWAGLDHIDRNTSLNKASLYV